MFTEAQLWFLLLRTFNIPNARSNVTRADERPFLFFFSVVVSLGQKLQGVTSRFIKGYSLSPKTSELILAFSMMSSGYDKTSWFSAIRNMLLLRKTLESDLPNDSLCVHNVLLVTTKIFNFIIILWCFNANIGTNNCP